MKRVVMTLGLVMALSGPSAEAGKSTPDEEWNDGWPDGDYCQGCVDTCTYNRNRADLECAAIAMYMNVAGGCWWSYNSTCLEDECGCDYLAWSECDIHCLNPLVVNSANNFFTFSQWLGCMLTPGCD